MYALAGAKESIEGAFIELAAEGVGHAGGGVVRKVQKCLAVDGDRPGAKAHQSVAPDGFCGETQGMKTRLKRFAPTSVGGGGGGCHPGQHIKRQGAMVGARTHRWAISGSTGLRMSKASAWMCDPLGFRRLLRILLG